MSFDLQVWGVKSKSLEDLDIDVCYGASKWQLVVSGPDPVEPEDIQPSISELMPGITCKYDISVEPIGAPDSAYKKAKTTASKLAKETFGVVFDPQEGTVTPAKGLKRYVPVARDERFETLMLAFWFVGLSMESKEGFKRFVDLLRGALPEALPNRYGLYEPPKFKLAEQGIDHYIDFHFEHLNDFIVTYPNRPVVGSHLTYRPCCANMGFMSNYFSIELEKSCLAQPGWNQQVERTFKQFIEYLDPFYADIRTISGNTRSGATYACDTKTGFHPIRHAMFRGVPDLRSHGVYVGKEYIEYVKKKTNGIDFNNGLMMIDATFGKETCKLKIDKKCRQKWIPKWARSKHGGKEVNWCDVYPEFFPFNRCAVAWDESTEGQGLRSVEEVIGLSGEKCIWASCPNKALKGMKVCSEHSG